MDFAKHPKAIVIGASAGGLTALSCILGKLPSNYIIPIIIVQHRAKDQRELLEQVLQAKCLIKIKQADEKEKIMPGTAYVAPPDYHLLIENDHTFSLSSDSFVNYSRPSIDVLFESAASVYRKHLAGLLLTGANSDGAMGIAAISKAGGTTIAQDPAEAEYSFMPTAAIETAGVNHIWKLAQIQTYLLKLNP